MTVNSSNGVQRQEFRNRQIRYLAACGVLLILATVIWIAVANTALAQSGGESTQPGHITVDVWEHGRDNAVRSLDFRVKWADPAGCSARYNAYLSYTNDDEPNRVLIASDAGWGGTAIWSPTSMSNPGGTGHAVELYCGTYHADSNENPIQSMPIPAHHFCVSGDTCAQDGLGYQHVTTYTTAPLLTSLAVSPGTLTPVFDKAQGKYTVPDVPHAQSQITIHVEEEIGYDIAFVKNPGSDVARTCRLPCLMSYGEGAVTLSDAEPALAGFQIDLDEGVNNLAVHIDPSTGWDELQNGGWAGRLYGLTITRAASDGSHSNTIPPTEIETGDTTTGESYMDVVVGYNTSPVGYSLSATWYDADNCSTDYHLYRHYAGYWDWDTRDVVPDDDPDATDHLGRVSSSSKSATYSPSTYGPGVAFDVALYCGPHDPDSRSNLVASVMGIQKSEIGNNPWVGTYSSGATILSLAVSPGALTPTFQRNVTSYTIPDVANDEDQLTVHASEQLGYDTFFVRNPYRSFGFIRVCPVNGWNCAHSSPGEVLQDADPGAPGFQIDLDVGENTFSIHASGVLGFVSSEFYDFTVTRRAQNNQAQGDPTISGTAQVGETLTVSTSGITDADGLTNATFAYQWLSSRDTEIDGATGSTYILADSDAGKTIKVRVDFTDDAGNEETLTSAATVAVTATVPGVPGNLSVSVNDTGKLDLSWDAPESNGGSTVTGYKVQWKAAPDSWDTPADVSETTVTGTSHTVTGLTDGVEYTFRLFAVNLAGDSSASEDESGTPRETTAPTVSSATVDGATLTLTFSEALTETPLPAVTTFTVNVGGNQRGVNTVAIWGRTVTLTLASAVTPTDAVSVGYTVSSDAAAARLKDLSDNPAESFTGQAVTNNTAAVQTPLTASIHDEPSSRDGQTEFTFELQFSEEPQKDFSYKTMRDHAFTVTGGSVTGARRLNPPSNIGWQINVVPDLTGDVTIVLPVTTDCTAQGAVCTEDGRMLSSGLEIVFPGPTPRQNSQATGSPTISGTALVGETLTASTSGIADADGLTNATYSYQWLSSRDTEIDGATGSTYVLLGSDAGKAMTVRVTFTDDAGNEETLTSAATDAVAPRPNRRATGAPAISGSPKVGQTLTATTSGIADADGMTDAVFAYRWILRDLTTNTDTDTEDGTGSTYVLADAAEGKAVKVRVTFTDDAGHVETLTSAATEAVSPRPNRDATGAPAISGTPEVGETLTATTSGIADADGLTDAVFAYRWVSHNPVDETDTDIEDATSSTYTVTEDDQGKAIKVRVTFTDDAGHEETLTSAATAAVPLLLTAAIHDKPAAPHDGENAFTFELRFSETPVKGFSYKTLKEDAFTVTGGAVVNAKRLEAGENVRWEITVRPDVDGDVVITLPATTNCDDDGAICTDDRRMLSSAVRLTVKGPSG